MHHILQLGKRQDLTPLFSDTFILLFCIYLWIDRAQLNGDTFFCDTFIPLFAPLL